MLTEEQKKFLDYYEEATKEFFANPTKETSDLCGSKLRATVKVMIEEMANTKSPRECYNFYRSEPSFLLKLTEYSKKINQLRSEIWKKSL